MNVLKAVTQGYYFISGRGIAAHSAHSAHSAHRFQPLVDAKLFQRNGVRTGRRRRFDENRISAVAPWP